MVNYRILVFNSEGQGKEALVSNWVGVHQPALVGNPYVRMNDDFKAVVTFDKVGGAKHAWRLCESGRGHICTFQI